MKELFKEFTVFPTWVIYRTLFQILLRKDHPWRAGPKINLENWAKYAKQPLIDFGIIFWVLGLLSIFLLSLLFS